MTSERYERPVILVSTPTRELIRDAASCQGYQQFSDAELKDAVDTISRPLAGLSGINSTR